MFTFEFRVSDTAIEPDFVIEAYSAQEAYDQWVEDDFGNGCAPYEVYISCDELGFAAWF